MFHNAQRSVPGVNFFLLRLPIFGKKARRVPRSGSALKTQRGPAVSQISGSPVCGLLIAQHAQPEMDRRLRRPRRREVIAEKHFFTAKYVKYANETMRLNHALGEGWFLTEERKVNEGGTFLTTGSLFGWTAHGH